MEKIEAENPVEMLREYFLSEEVQAEIQGLEAENPAFGFLTGAPMQPMSAKLPESGDVPDLQALIPKIQVAAAALLATMPMQAYATVGDYLNNGGHYFENESSTYKEPFWDIFDTEFGTLGVFAGEAGFAALYAVAIGAAQGVVRVIPDEVLWGLGRKVEAVSTLVTFIVASIMFYSVCAATSLIRYPDDDFLFWMARFMGAVMPGVVAPMTAYSLDKSADYIGDPFMPPMMRRLFLGVGVWMANAGYLIVT